MPARIVYLGLGSNVGDRLKNLQNAVRLLSSKINVSAVSDIYESVPEGEGESESPLFLNMAIAVETILSLEDLLILCKGIEVTMGRKQEKRNAPRVIDLDILCAEETSTCSPQLSVPHASMHRRAFVLAPLCELCPDYIHPLLGKTVEELLGELPISENAEYWGELNIVF